MAQTSEPDNKSVLITGCSSGIGDWVARGLHARGYRVFASVRNPQDSAAFQQAGIECLQLDYSNSASIRSAVEQVLEQTGGRLYALFNNVPTVSPVPVKISAVRQCASNSKPMYSAGWS